MRLIYEKVEEFATGRLSVHQIARSLRFKSFQTILQIFHTKDFRKILQK